jgi:hypothetical protein
MERRPARIGASLMALTVSMVLGGLASPARAGLVIASDPYLIGSGGYAAGTSLLKQPSVAATGFVSGSTYNSGSLTNNFIVQAGGLAATDPADAGHVSYTGVGSDTAIRSNARLLNPVTSSGTYWFSINVSQDGSSFPIAGSPTGYALAGYGNTTPPVLGATTTTGLPSGSPAFLQGLFFGFAHEANDPANSNGDLVIRYRNSIGDTSGDAVLLTSATANTTYTIIAKLDVNVNGGSVDNLTYWLNPTNTSSEAALDASSSVTNFANPLATFAFQTPADFFRLTYSAQSWNGDGGSASFGDPTSGLTLADVVPAAVPEPSSIAMMAMGVVGGLGRAIRRRRALA